MVETVLESKKNNFLWLDLVEPTEEELQDVAGRFGLHTTSLEDCLDPIHQPKFEKVQNTVFIILRAYDTRSRLQTDSIHKITRKLAIFLGNNFIITVHRSELDFVNELKDEWKNRCARDEKSESNLIILLGLVKGAVYSYSLAFEKLEEAIEGYEGKIFTNDDTPVNIKEIHEFRSKVSAIRRVLRQLYDVILKIDDYTDEFAPVYQDIRERLERYLMLTDALREASNDILNTHISLASHRTNEVIRVLTIFSVFFLPLTFIVGIYGMNFKYMPELKTTYGYPSTWLVMVLITAGIYTWFKRRGWLK
ncbi:Mg2 transporter protein CorA family protein [Thermincola ferriacetica]|uniref:Mg2 transporter protein CorA family protein n=1 Tax=Thermincola ferriacetica TaxID=281456 RepID=A0A0L6W6E2_9FIRM|nr:CorA family divalent cation transporter [Thermincola ferriacetica]KNZ71152.1 Mg2 transporter protein CorA family protein [Thermincola ferriacetica]